MKKGCHPWLVAVMVLMMMICSVDNISAETRVLKFAHFMPAVSDIGQTFEWWARQVNERSHGKVKVEVYPMNNLIETSQVVDAIRKKRVEISVLDATVFAKKFPITNMFNLPTVTFPSDEQGMIDSGEAFIQVYNNFEAMRKEYEDYKLVMISGLLGYSIVAKQEVHVPADLQGRNMAATGLAADIAKNCGATPVKIFPPEAHMCLQHGIIDAMFSNWAIVLSRQLHEVSSFYLEDNIIMFPQPVIMNLDTWNSLPEDVQKVIDQLAPETLRFRCALNAKLAEKAKGIWRKSNGIIGHLTQEQLQIWDEKGLPLEQQWLDEMAGLGQKDAPAMLKELKALRAKSRG